MRVRLCFKCKQYVPILENDYLNRKELEAFEKAHSDIEYFIQRLY